MFNRFFLQILLVDRHNEGLGVPDLLDAHGRVVHTFLFSKCVDLDFTFGLLISVDFIGARTDMGISTTELIFKRWVEDLRVLFPCTLRKSNIGRNKSAHLGERRLRGFPHIILRVFEAGKTRGEVGNTLIIKRRSWTTIFIARLRRKTLLFADFDLDGFPTAISRDDEVVLEIWNIGGGPTLLILKLWICLGKLMNLSFSFVFAEFLCRRFLVFDLDVLLIGSWETWTIAVCKVFGVFSAHLLRIESRNILIGKLDVVFWQVVRITFGIINQLIFARWLSDWVRWRIKEFAVLSVKGFGAFWVLAFLISHLGTLRIRILVQLTDLSRWLKRHERLMVGALLGLFEKRINRPLTQIFF